MGVFDDREKAQENKYFHDQDLKFKAVSRRNKLFGLWAAGLLSLKASEADAYSLEVVKADFQEPGDADILRKVTADLQKKGIAKTQAELEKQLEACLAEAIRQLEAEAKTA